MGYGPFIQLIKNLKTKTMITTKKTAVVSFKTTPQHKQDLESTSKDEGTTTGPFVEKILRKLLESDYVKTIMEKHRNEMGYYLTRDGRRQDVQMTSTEAAIQSLFMSNDTLIRVLSILKKEGRFLYSFASDEENEKIAMEVKEEKKIALNTEVQNQRTTETV